MSIQNKRQRKWFKTEEGYFTWASVFALFGYMGAVGGLITAVVISAIKPEADLLAGMPIVITCLAIGVGFHALHRSAN